ncbi:MAG TPA: Ig-like domain-containing protein, partial [Terriglobales bacterium]|nr:Ig-like domain-containing protein [Terriglobales bacterium]
MKRTIFRVLAVALGCMAFPGMLFGKSPSSVTISSSLNPSTYGSSVTLTAMVTPLAATGTITFKDGNTMLGTGTISGGVATFSNSKLAQGSHYLTAVYGGSAKYNGSTSLLLIQVVNKANTTVTLASSANPSTYSSSVKFTATVTPTTATGTVTFMEGTATLGTGTISAGKATFSISTLAVGSNSIAASYGGDTNDNSSTSTVLTQTINSAPQVVTTSLPAGTAGTSYSATLAAT